MLTEAGTDGAAFLPLRYNRLTIEIWYKLKLLERLRHDDDRHRRSPWTTFGMHRLISSRMHKSIGVARTKEEAYLKRTTSHGYVDWPTTSRSDATVGTYALGALHPLLCVGKTPKDWFPGTCPSKIQFYPERILREASRLDSPGRPLPNGGQSASHALVWC